MRPVYQTIFGKPDGNCLAACIASILEVDLEIMPHFHGDDWHEQWNGFLRNFGLCMWRIDVPADEKTPFYVPPGWTVLSGLSPRAAEKGEDWLHATVAFDGETVHDPHPDGRGVLTKSDYLIFQALDPSLNDILSDGYTRAIQR